MYGSSLGYVSRTLERIARWALDFTLDFAPEVMLLGFSIGFPCVRGSYVLLFLEHGGRCVGGEVLMQWG